MGGLSDFPILTKKNHGVPGPGKYSLPSGFGPQSGTKHVSILGARSPRNVTDSHLGPGTYDHTSTLGGPSHTIAAPVVDAQLHVSQSGSIGPKYDMNQYAMAEHPSTPRYSMGGKGIPKSPRSQELVQPGPGSYNFDPDTNAVSKFKQASVRIAPPPPRGGGDSGRLLGPRTQAFFNPGPGSYESPRFAEGGKTLGGVPPPRRREPDAPGPGPGAYLVDQHTIGHARSPRSKMATASSFGGKGHPLVGASCAPGPGQYALPNTWLGKGKSIGNRPESYGDLDAVNPKPGPGEYHLPSAAFPGGKGYSISPRYEAMHSHAASPGPGSYGVQRDDLSAMAERMRQLEQLSTKNGAVLPPRSRVTSPRQPTEASQRTPGPGSYGIPGSIDPGKGTSLGSRPDSHWRKSQWLDDLSHSPGPGTYDFQKHAKTDDKGSTFYKGGFVPLKKEIKTPGPGAYETLGSFNATQPNKSVGFSSTTHLT